MSNNSNFAFIFTNFPIAEAMNIPNNITRNMRMMDVGLIIQNYSYISQKFF